MFKISFSEVLRPASLVMAVLSASVLSGCVAQDMALDDGFVPYTLDERYPLEAVNGKVVRKPCGKWPTNLADTSNNQRFKNHGCAVRANMAAMIANPDDIIEPHPVALSPAPGPVQAVKRISNGQTTGSSSRTFFSFF